MMMRDDSTPIRFFAIVLVLSLPFYALGATGGTLPFAPALPISAVMACVPMTAALNLVTRQDGFKAARGLFASAFHVRTILNIWWAIVALRFMPVAFLITGRIVWLSGVALPNLQLSRPNPQGPFPAYMPDVGPQDDADAKSHRGLFRVLRWQIGTLAAPSTQVTTPTAGRPIPAFICLLGVNDE